jgi:hypothetical protein
MKKIWLFVILGLTFAGLPLFAGGIFDGLGGGTTAQSGVMEAAAVAEMPTEYPPPRQRQDLKQADGWVYALPATPLKPEPERLPPPVYAISGVRGQEIMEDSPLEAVDINVILPEKETFSRGILEGEDVSNWIVNLPRGLEARAHGTKRGATSIKIYISGTPEVTMREVIRVTIPGTYLTGGSARSFVSPGEEESNRAWEASQTQE